MTQLSGGASTACSNSRGAGGGRNLAELTFTREQLSDLQKGGP
jgi:hypothetical protein